MSLGASLSFTFVGSCRKVLLYFAIHVTLKMTSAHVLETLVIVNNDNHTRQTVDTPGLKLFTRSALIIENTGFTQNQTSGLYKMGSQIYVRSTREHRH